MPEVIKNIPGNKDGVQRSALDRISDYISPMLRRTGDYLIRIGGTATQVLRITKTSKEAWIGNSKPGHQRDVFGGSKSELQMDIIGNTIIKYPGNKVELFSHNVAQVSTTNALNPEENLPIEFIIQFAGTYDRTPMVPERGDLFVDYVIDENGNVIPLIMEVMQLFGTFSAKNVTRKSGNLSMYRGPLEKELQAEVKPYLALIANTTTP